MATKQVLSKYVSKQLDNVGFSKESVRERSETIYKCSMAKDYSTKRITGINDIEEIIVGSKREGLGLDYLYDTDVLQIDNGIYCRHNPQHFGNIGKTVFKMEEINVPPGYCLLKLAGDDFPTEIYQRISYALDKKTAGHYLSSDILMSKNDHVFCNGTGYIKRNTRLMHRQGPSIPMKVECPIDCYISSQFGLKRTEIDFVRAFPCEVDELLMTWRDRKRQSGWPTAAMIDYVMKQPVHVVPVGQKGSLNDDLQWRICFNMAEMYLVQSFNITQTKVFVLLKLIAKHILRPVSSSITSFVMKNVVLWLAEKTLQEEYHEEHLLDRLKDALEHLKEYVDKAELPCYMIPQRNLFAGKLQGAEQSLILEKLSNLLRIGLDFVASYFRKTSFNEDIDRMIESHSNAYKLDKKHTCAIATLSLEELTEQNKKVLQSETNLEFQIYNSIFHTTPFCPFNSNL